MLPQPQCLHLHLAGATTALDRLARNPDLLRYTADIIPDKLMFASNYPSCFAIKAGIEALENTTGLTEEFKKKMFYENAVKFYGFE